MSDEHIRDGEPPEDEFQRRARAIIDEEWLAAGVTEEELARSRRAAWARASRPSAGSPEQRHGQRDHESVDRLLSRVDDIEAELEAIRAALGAIREPMPDSAPSSLDRD